MTRARVVRLVATDLDGTLLRSDGSCSGAGAGGAGRGRACGRSGGAGDCATTAVAARYCGSCRRAWTRLVLKRGIRLRRSEPASPSRALHGVPRRRDHPR